MVEGWRTGEMGMGESGETENGKFYDGSFFFGMVLKMYSAIF